MATILMAVLVLAVAWLALGPRQLAGQDTYVVTDGISMLPHFHGGDLVILRKESSYHVGEVAGYHNAQLGVVVMHRIIAIKGGRFEFKGDNNNFVDPYQPTKAQIVGAEWIHVPRAGRVIRDLRSPVVFALVLALLWIFSFRSRTAFPRRRRRHQHVS